MAISRQQAVFTMSNLSGIADRDGIGFHVPVHQGARLDHAIIADRDPRQDDRACAQMASSANARVEVNAACEIMRKDDGFVGYISMRADVDSTRPRSVDESVGLDTGAGMDVHAPESSLYQTMYRLTQTDGPTSFHRFLAIRAHYCPLVSYHGKQDFGHQGRQPEGVHWRFI